MTGCHAPRPFRQRSARLGSALLLALAAGPLAAQSLPDAGSLLRQAERAGGDSPQAPPPVPQAATIAPAAAAPRFVVHRFQVRGATLLPAAELERSLDRFLDRPIELAELEAGLLELVGHYRRAGWHARVQLPEQDITEGTVVVEVIEGRFGQLLLQPLAAGSRANGAQVAGFVQRHLQPGQPYRLDRIERGLLLANDLPGVRVDGVLQAGQAPGSTDLLLQVRDGPLLGGSVSLGNDGSRYSGRAQAVARLALDNPSGLGDQLGASLIRSQGLRYAGANYSIALGSSGLRASLGQTALDYRLGKEFDALDSSGSSRMRRAALGGVFLRGVETNLEWSLSWTGRVQRDDSFGMPLRRRRVNDLGLSLYGDFEDEWLHRGRTAWALDLVSGRAHLDLPDDLAADSIGPEVEGRFHLASLELMHERWLSPDWRVRARLQGQWAGSNLDSSQQFVLGGPQGVRGYPVNEAGGDSGAVLQLELHRPLPLPSGRELDSFLFLDHGRIRQHRQAWATLALEGGAPNGYGLSAAGLGLGWNRRGGLEASLSLAHPLGHNPGGIGGRNQDGSRRGTQAWFNIRQRF